MRIFSITLSAVIMIPVLVIANSPNLISYQGRLTTSGGAPVPDATYSVVFTIYDASSLGNTLWTEPQNITTAGGLFAVMLGSVNSINDVIFSDTVRYLGIKVGGDPEMTPRTRLVSVPYAERVNTIDGSRGGAISGSISLENSTASSGIVFKGNLSFLHNFGVQNTFVGQEAGNLIMTGAANTASGSGALFSNTSGSDNTANGEQALWKNTSGNSNTATGARALNKNTTGFSNTANGWQALFNNISGFSNSAFGHQALWACSNGVGNTASGFNSLAANSVGNNNTASGYSTLGNNTSGYGNTASGYTALFSNSTGVLNTASGSEALSFNTTGSRNAAVGNLALKSNTTGSKNTAIGASADVSTGNLTNATAIGYKAIVDASDKIRIGNDSVTVIEAQVGLTIVSDSAQKENFQPVDGQAVLEKIGDLKVRTWNYKGHDPARFRHYGPIAQEFYAAFGRDGVGSVGTPTTINSQDMDGVMLVAIQTLAKKNRALEAQTSQLAELAEENTNLRVRLEKLEAMLSILVDARKHSAAQPTEVR